MPISLKVLRKFGSSETWKISADLNNIFVLQYPPLDFNKFLEIDAQCTVSCTKRSAIKNVNNQYVPHWGSHRDKASYYLYDEDCENNLYRFEIKIETNSILLKDMFKNCSLLSGDKKQLNWAASLDLRNFRTRLFTNVYDFWYKL